MWRTRLAQSPHAQQFRIDDDAFLLGQGFLETRHPIAGVLFHDLELMTVLDMLCLCKQPHQSRWNRQINFARIRRVPQEAKKDWVPSRSMIANSNSTAVSTTNRPLV